MSHRVKQPNHRAAEKKILDQLIDDRLRALLQRQIGEEKHSGSLTQWGRLPDGGVGTIISNHANPDSHEQRADNVVWDALREVVNHVMGTRPGQIEVMTFPVEEEGRVIVLSEDALLKAKEYADHRKFGKLLDAVKSESPIRN